MRGLIAKFIVLFVIAFFSQASFAAANVDEKTGCKAYPGLVNKIVMCITDQIAKESEVSLAIETVHAGFVDASNAMIVLVILFFGAKVMLMGADKLRTEIAVLFFTIMAIGYFNNKVVLVDMLKFFLSAQEEFANAATTAISVKTCTDKNCTKTENPVYQYGLCYGPAEVDSAGKVKIETDNAKPNFGYPTPKTDPITGKPLIYNVWQRIDCTIGYLLGAHPLIHKIDASFSKNTSDASDKNFDYSMFAGDNNPFANMAEEPFAWFGKDHSKSTLLNSEKKEVRISFAMVSILFSMIFNIADLQGVGLISIITGFFVVMLMIAAFSQAMIVYITSMLAIIILMIFAPIIIPLFLFRQTKQIFTTWLQMIITYILQPGILLVYLSFMMFVIQHILQYEVKENPADPASPTVFHSMADYHTEMLKYYEYSDCEVGSEIQNMTNNTFGLSNDDAASQDKQDGGTSTNTIVAAVRAGKAGEITATSKSVISQAGSVAQTAAASTASMTEEMSNTGHKKGGLYVGKITVPCLKLKDGNEKTMQEELKKLKEDQFSPLATVAQLSSGLTYNINNSSEGFANKIDLTANVGSPFDFLKKNNAANAKEYKLKNDYMHVMLISLITMAITLAFMNNVLTFGNALAGAGTLPMNKMANFYSAYVNKLSKSLNPR